MKVISFHLKGKMAHFRRYYSNSSALTYTIPPRTTIIGIIAGILGYERDSYYEEFSLERCRISVALCSSIKKIVQKLNLLKVESKNDLNGSKEHHSQTATELIIPQDIRTGCLDYQIWLNHEAKEIMNKLEQLLNVFPHAYCSKRISMGLGTAYNVGWIEYDGIFEAQDYEGTNLELISSVIPIAKLKRIYTEKMTDGRYAVVKEELPLEFDKDRKITSKGIGDIIFDINGKPIPASVVSCVKLDNDKTIMWTE